MELPAQNLWHVDLLGTLRAVSNKGTRIEHFQTRQTAALFAFLVYQSLGTTSELGVPREVAAELLWVNAPPESARRRLAQALSWLRRRLEGEAGMPPGTVLETDRQSLRLNPALVTTDIDAFQQLLEAAEGATQASERMRLYEEAVERYRGELLPGFYDDWVLRERERLANLYLGALHHLIDGWEKSGDIDRALRIAHTAITTDPYDETARESVVRLLAAAGQSSAALRHYTEWERRLKTEEDRPPAASLQALAERLRSQKSVPSATPLPERLPVNTPPLTRFFGRETETTQIVSLLRARDVRLVTLTGTGGTGKTRLALEVARQLRALPGIDTVVFVPLADLSDTAHIPAAIAEALFRTDPGIPSSPPAAVAAQDFLLEKLSRGNVVLMLDNLEHLQNAGPEAVVLVRQLLQAVPRLSILITSRQRLAIAGEQEFPVPPLPSPRPPSAEASQGYTTELSRSPSVQLFVNRAQAVRPDFQITESNASVVAELCTRLEGIPLAIELCAAWAQILTPAQMLQRLERRFDLLVSRRVDIEERHRTLRATLEYGYILLEPRSKRLFSQLALFQGGWTLAAAESVCAETEENAPRSLLSALTELRERSLILAEENVGTGVMRFRMLETLREFAGEQLSFADAIDWRRRHAAYFTRIAEDIEPLLSGPEQGRSLNILETEHDNLRAALSWAGTEDSLLGLRLASALAPFWDTRGHLREGRDWLGQLLKTTGEEASPLVLARAWSAMGRLAFSQGDFAEAGPAHEKALDLWRRTGNERGIAWALYDLGATSYRKGEMERSRPLVEESLALAERCGEDACVARALNQLGNLTLMDDESAVFYQRSLTVSQARGDRQFTSTALHNLGTVAGLKGDHVSADSYFHAALAIRRDLQDDYGVMTTLMNLGKNALLQNRLPEAGELLEEAARLAWETGRKHVLAYCLKDLGLLAMEHGRDMDGVRCLSAALRISEEISAPIAERYRYEYETALDRAKSRLDQAAYSVAWSSGQSVPLGEIMASLSDTPKSSPAGALLGTAAPDAPKHCVYCGGAHLVRHGYAPNGKQKYRCRDCGRSTRENPGLNGYDAATREEILAVYRAGGVSLRGLTQRFGVSRNTVLAWLHRAS
jgi:predicted ATPase/DNA-binding SARP family transcriptional activator